MQAKGAAIRSDPHLQRHPPHRPFAEKAAARLAKVVLGAPGTRKTPNTPSARFDVLVDEMHVHLEGRGRRACRGSRDKVGRTGRFLAAQARQERYRQSDGAPVLQAVVGSIGPGIEDLYWLLSTFFSGPSSPAVYMPYRRFIDLAYVCIRQCGRGLRRARRRGSHPVL
jgi:hypothetical protein